MGSIPSDKLCEIADAVAFGLELPWRVEDLRIKALEAYRAATHRATSSGLSREQASAQMDQLIREPVMKAGERMDQLAFGQSEPTDKQIRVALLTSSVGQWRILIDGFGQSHTDTLLAYLHTNKGPLENRLGRSNFGPIQAHGIRRHLLLRWDQPGTRFVVVTDAYEVARIHKTARQRNIGMTPKPPGQQRSWDEMSRPNHISERLSMLKRKVTPYTVREILKRMKQTSPYDFDGSILDYLMWATDPTAYERELSARATAEPPRDPDPFFSSEN